MLAIPYIGITGFKHLDDVAEVDNWVTGHFRLAGYQVMFGFTVSNKRLEDRKSEGKTSPNVLKLEDLCGEVNCQSLTMLHYFTEHPENLAQEVVTLFTDPEIGCGYQDELDSEGLYQKNLCRALQLNQDWPNPQTLAEIKKQLPELEIVLQVSPKALEASDQEIVQRSAEYQGLVNYLLLDPSGGQGKALDLSRTKKLLPELQKLNLRIGIAGGLGPDNLTEILPEVKSVSSDQFCIDAQGKLRTNDRLDPDKAIRYLEQASKFLK